MYLSSSSCRMGEDSSSPRSIDGAKTLISGTTFVPIGCLHKNGFIDGKQTNNITNGMPDISI